MKLPIFAIIIFFFLSFNFAFAQEPIVIEPSEPCFLNYTARNMFKNCGFEQDYLKAALLPWDWVTGGHFSMFFITVLIFISYVKYQKAVYPLIIGTLYLPVAYVLYPTQFFIFAIIMAGAAIAFLLWYIFVRQTKEY